MPRPCSVCGHPERVAIDTGLVSGHPYRDLAKRHPPVSISALSRHRRDHVSPALSALRGEVVREQRPLLDEIRRLVDRTERFLAAAEESGSVAQGLAAVRELRGLFELIGRVTGELDERPQVNVLNVAAAPEWLEVRGRLLAALAPYPEARAAASGALLEAAR